MTDQIRHDHPLRLFWALANGLAATASMFHGSRRRAANGGRQGKPGHITCKPTTLAVWEGVAGHDDTVGPGTTGFV